MTGSWIEDRLHRLVDEVDLPATSTAFRKIEQRQRSLRRRRRRYVGAAIVASVVVAAVTGVAVRRGNPALEVDPAGPGNEDGAGSVTGSGDEEGLPALTLDLDGWEVTAASEEHDLPFASDEPTVPDDSTEAVQVFRQPGELTGPSIYLHHTPGRGTGRIVEQFPDDVTIGDAQGRAWVIGEDVTVSWDLPDGHSSVWLRASGGLDLDQVLDFAAGLRPRDGEISLPPSPDDRFGFVATAPIADLVEVPGASRKPATVDRREITLRKEGAQVEIVVDNAGMRAFEDALAASLGVREHVMVDDRPAVAFTRAIPITEDRTILSGDVRWMQTTTARVVVHLTFVDPHDLDDILDGIHQISHDDWDALLAAAPTPTTATFPQPPQPSTPPPER